MSDESKSIPPKTLPGGKIDEVLLKAWEKLLDYDRRASAEKRSFSFLRHAVIIITLLGTWASVITLLWASVPDQDPNVMLLLGFVALALPLGASGLMLYISLFSKSTTWIQYRYIAEKLRHHVYLYRAYAADYATDDDQRDDKLNKAIKEIGNVLLNIVPEENARKRRNILSILRKKSEESDAKATEKEAEADVDVVKDDANPETATTTSVKPNKNTPYYLAIKPALRNSDADDGFSSFRNNIALYTKIRLDAQKDWYDKRVRVDYNIAKRMTITAICISLGGSLAGFWFLRTESAVLGVTIIACLNAFSVAIKAWSNVHMFGKSYGIFSNASKQLDDCRGDLLAMKNDKKTPEERKEAHRKWIEAVEAVLMTELEEWYRTATETQITNDQFLESKIEEIKTRAQVSNNVVIESAINHVKTISSKDRNTEIDKLITELNLLRADK